ncbi:MAG TPA: hypothetical protein ENI44_03090 [Thermoplasmatales archaeon]|nr:hypothetical protein [Thermoplasmatales archaeon]
MIKNGFQGGRRKGVIFGVVAIALIFISSTTMVPQVQGSTAVKQLDKIYSSPVFILARLFKQISNKDIPLYGSDIDQLGFIKDLISWLLSLLKKGGTKNGSILNFLMSLLSIPALLIKLLIKAGSALVSSILKVIGAIIGIIALIFLGLQTGLTLTALLIILMGFISKIGIKIFAVIGAPIFALIAAQLSILSGTLLGGVSMILHSFIAIAIFLAIPITIAAVLYLLISGGEGGGGSTPGNEWGSNICSDLLYMILSVIAYYLKGGE